MNKQLFGTGDVSKLLNIARHKLEYAISNGSIPEPKQRIANKRAFALQEVKAVAEYFGVTISEQGE